MPKGKPYVPKRRPTLEEYARELRLEPQDEWWRERATRTRVITFFIPLPEPLGFSAEASLTAVFDPLPRDLQGVATECYWPRWDEPAWEKNYFNLRFIRLNVPFSEVQPGLVLAEKAAKQLGGKADLVDWSIADGASATVAAVSTLLDRELLAADGALAVGKVFDSAIAHLRRTLYNFVVAGQTAITPVTRQLLPMTIFGWLDDATEPRFDPEQFSYFVGTSARRALPPKDISPEQIRLALSLLASPASGGHPSFGFAQVRNEAQLALEDRGDARSALLGAATAAEMFLDTLLVSLLWEESVPPSDATMIFETKRLAKRVREEYHNRIGGNWTAGAIGHWRTAVADVRNQVVHWGALPDEIQAHMALDSLSDVVSYIYDLLCEPKVQARYPRTCLIICGRAAADRRQAFRKPLRDLIQDSNADDLASELNAFSKLVFARQ
jgi:hypothetical protein